MESRNAVIPTLCRCLPPTQARKSVMILSMYSWCCNTVNRITRLTTLLKFGSKAPLNIAEKAAEQDPSLSIGPRQL